MLYQRLNPDSNRMEVKSWSWIHIGTLIPWLRPDSGNRNGTSCGIVNTVLRIRIQAFLWDGKKIRDPG